MCRPWRSERSGSDLRREWLYLGRERLLCSVILSGTFGWLWFPYVMFRGWPIERDLVPILALIISSGVSLYLYFRSDNYYYYAASATLIGMLVAYASMVHIHYGSVAVYFGVIIIIATNMLLGAPQALLALVLVWAAGTLLPSRGEMRVDSRSAEVLLLDVMAFVFVALNSRSLTTAVEWAMNGWAKASTALMEARRSQAELHRVVRALEEATYRIERMNRELIMAHHQAEAERDSKARFAAIVSHELRGPLSLILGFSRIMVLSPERYGEALPRSYRSDIVTIFENSRHLAALVDDVLDLSRIDADRLSLVRDEIDIKVDVVIACVNAVRPWAKRKGLYLRCEIPERLPRVVADRIRIRQVLLNLLTNAVRFTETGGIVITATEQDSHIEVSVGDTGAGIPASDIPHVFDEFRQTYNPRDGGIGGTGLGLSISKQLVRLHGGDIWVHSTEGAGAEFTFAIPVAASSPQRGRLVTTNPSMHRSRPPDTCLVVHHDPDVVRYLARQLGDYHVVGVPDSERVPALVEQLYPVGIIASPNASIRICQQLAVRHASIPVLTCDFVHLHADYGGVPILGHLAKPFTEEMLMVLMRQVNKEGELTVLLVDDDPDAVRLLEDMLAMLPRSYRILKAYDGLEALQVLEHETPDVALIDLAMPCIGGRELIRRMAERMETHRLPVIVVSGNDTALDDTRLATPICVHSSQAISVGRAASLFRAAFEAFRPKSLSEDDPRPAAGPVD